MIVGDALRTDAAFSDVPAHMLGLGGGMTVSPLCCLVSHMGIGDEI